MNSFDSSISQLEARLDGIGHVLRDRRLSVPLFQRSYAWDYDQVDTFWSDLRSALLAPKPSYFLGTIVLTSENDTRESTVIDGQQRLATAAILIAAIRDEFASAGDNQRAAALQSEYLTYRDLKRGGETPRLKLNSNDQEYFSETIMSLNGSKDIPPSGSSHRRLQTAYELLRRRVSEEVRLAKSKWPERLVRWVEFVEYEVKSIVVDVPIAADAFLIFETLNDRGVALSVADLLKSYIYATSGERIREVRSGWEVAASTLESLDDEQRLLDFLRQYWSSWYGAVRERDLYRHFRMRVRSPDQAVEFTEKIAQASPNFLALVTGDSTLWPNNDVSEEEAETLHLLQLTQNRPLLLAAMDHFSSTELRKLTLASIGWLVRGLIVGGIGGGTTERYYCDAAMRIRDGRAKTTQDVFDFLQDMLPSDEQFRAAAASMTAPRANLCRYLLLAYDQHLAGKRNPSVVSRSAHDSCYAQRIVPGSPVADWVLFPDEETPGWSKRFGNFVLLPRGAGARRAERTWEDIRGVLEDSNYVSSQDLVDLNDWSPEDIQARQRSFAESAPAIWPREF